MIEATIALGAKALGLVLIVWAFSYIWTAVQMIGGDKLAFRQAKQHHPKARDALFGRTMLRPSKRHGAPVNDGVVLRRTSEGVSWYLNSRMSDEQYDRLTK